METIRKQYIVNEQQQRVAVQIAIADFEKIEQILEDYALGQLMQENDPEDSLDTAAAKEYYDSIR